MSDEIQAIVTEWASGMVKGGFAGDDAPRAVFPCILGFPKYTGVMVGMGQKDTYVGDEAQSQRGYQSLPKVVHRGRFPNTDNLEKIIHHTCYNEIRVSPEEHPFLCAEPVFQPKVDREHLTQILFETFNVPAMYLATDAVLALYASGATSGMMICCGEGITSTVPIFEGYAIPPAIRRMDFAGIDLTYALHQLLKEVGRFPYFSTNMMPFWEGSTVELEIIRDIKEKLCHVRTANYENSLPEYDETEYTEKKEYELPDGNIITLPGDVRWKIGEMLFNPAVWGSVISERIGDCPSLPDMLMDSILACDVDTRPIFFGRMVLAGGTTMLPGFGERLEKEMSARLAKRTGHDPPYLRYARPIGLWEAPCTQKMLIPYFEWKPPKGLACANILYNSLRYRESELGLQFLEETPTLEQQQQQPQRPQQQPLQRSSGQQRQLQKSEQGREEERDRNYLQRLPLEVLERVFQNVHQEPMGKNYVLGSAKLKPRVLAPPERKYTAWIGGSILASLSTFQQMWVSKQEYDESGPSIVNRKCNIYGRGYRTHY